MSKTFLGELSGAALCLQSLAHGAVGRNDRQTVVLSSARRRVRTNKKTGTGSCRVRTLPRSGLIARIVVASGTPLFHLKRDDGARSVDAIWSRVSLGGLGLVVADKIWTVSRNTLATPEWPVRVFAERSRRTLTLVLFAGSVDSLLARRVRGRDGCQGTLSLASVRNSTRGCSSVPGCWSTIRRICCGRPRTLRFVAGCAF